MSESENDDGGIVRSILGAVMCAFLAGVTWTVFLYESGKIEAGQ